MIIIYDYIWLQYHVTIYNLAIIGWSKPVKDGLNIIKDGLILQCRVNFDHVEDVLKRIYVIFKTKKNEKWCTMVFVGEEVAGPIFDRGLVTEDAHISMRPQYSSGPGEVSLKLNLLVKSLWDRYNSSSFTTNDHVLLLTYMWFIIRFSGEGSYSILPRITSKSCIHTLNRIYISWRWSVAASGLRRWPGIAGRPRALQGALQCLAWKGMNVVWKFILKSQAMGFQTLPSGELTCCYGKSPCF